MEDVKQVIVVRKDLNMRKGKIAAQVAHASVKSISDNMNQVYVHDTASRSSWYKLEYNLLKDSPVYTWLTGIFKKIVVYVKSEKEFFEIVDKCKDNDIATYVILDAGLTEFKKPTYTAVAIGPDFESKIDKVTGDLPLL